MEDVPQPSSKPYAVGDDVQIYLDPEDADAQHHGTVCEVVSVDVDDLDSETGRPLDAYTYTLQPTGSHETLPLTFRHRDLVPVEGEH